MNVSQIPGQITGPLRPWLLLAGTLAAAALFVDHFLLDIPRVSLSTNAAIAAGLAIWAGR